VSASDLDLANDQEARRLARERFDVPVLIEAGAGTGKTRTLIERLLAWTLEIGWAETTERLDAHAAGAGRPRVDLHTVAGETLDGVVAITFTDAAAAEMASRLGSALAQLARGGIPDEASDLAGRLGPETVRDRAGALAEQLGRARIQTIHAFCRALLAQHPFDAGLHPAFEIDSEQQALERIATEVLSARLSAALAAGDADWIELLGDGASPEELFDALVAAVARGVSADELETEPFPLDQVAAMRHEVRAELAPLATALTAVAGRLGARAVADRVEGPLRGVADDLARDEAPLAEISRQVDALLAHDRDTLRGWAAGKSIGNIEKKLPSDAQPFTEVAGRALCALDRLAGLDPEALARARRVLAPLVREVRERLRRGGFVLFEDLLTRAARLLESRADVCASARRGIRQLLVDEFQDTDRRQCDLVARLALDDGPGEAPGLFVVGDPKQSIYGWRNADLSAYEGFLRRARERGAVYGRLAMNFRSLPAILDEVERVLAPLLVAEPGLQPAFERLRPSPKRSERGRELAEFAAVEHWVSIAAREGAKTRSGKASRIEARAIAADLLAQRRRDSTLRWSQVALLARTGSDLEIYLDALREAGIAFAVERDRSYWRRREIIDAAALVRATVDPGDHVALVTLLRAPFVGVPDAALLGLWRAGFPARVDALVAPDAERLAELRALLDAVARDLPDGVPGLDRIEGWEASAFAALEALAELRAALGREPAERFVERLRSRFALEATAAARYLGRFGVANLERFCRELEEFLEDSGDDPAALVRFLRRAVAERRDAEEARPAEPDDDAVRVMTIHRAKGLQFRHVYLVQIHKGTGAGRRQDPFASERLVEGGLAYRLFGWRSLGWAMAGERRELVAEREEARLLYVALTRAEDRLVVAGQRFSTRGGPGSFVESFRERLASSPAAALREGGGIFAPVLDRHGALWRAPALEPEWTVESVPRDLQVPFTPDDPAVLARDLDTLTTRCAAAEARSARSRFARASDLGGFEPETLEETRDERLSIEEDRSRARALGVALHRALELSPLASIDAAAWMAAVQAAFLDSHRGSRAADLAELGKALESLRSSLLWKSLSLLEGKELIVARELPLVVAASPSEPAAGPTDATIGTLDLLYRDPDSGALVIADFKSDAVADETAIAAKVATYRPQLELYGRAVRTALGEAALPRLELWLLQPDRVVEIPAGEPPRDSG
jgi:ATP-dependent helicase/nuclease subunit A